MSKEAIESSLRELNGYDLTLEEKRALREHDSDAVLDLGVPPDLLRGLDVLPPPDRSSGSR